jgi:transcriptional regulator with XRE-family HTH domain
MQAEPRMGTVSEASSTDFRAPTPEEIGDLVRRVRKMMGWKMETLADFAQVSLSSVERVERGVKASEEVYRRLALALHFQPDDFIRPRRVASVEEAVEKALKFFEGRVIVPAERLCRRPQLARLLDAHVMLVDDGRCDDATRATIPALREWLGFGSFALGMSQDPNLPNENLTRDERNKILDDILAEVAKIEYRGFTALMTVYDADMPLMGKQPLGVIAFFPKLTDPAASKRSFLVAQAGFRPEEMRFDFLGDLQPSPSM